MLLLLCPSKLESPHWPTVGLTVLRCAVVLLLLCPLVPESPHWLLVAGDADGAEALLRNMAALQGTKLPAGRLARAHGGGSAADTGAHLGLAVGSPMENVTSPFERAGMETERHKVEVRKMS